MLPFWCSGKGGPCRRIPSSQISARQSNSQGRSESGRRPFRWPAFHESMWLSYRTQPLRDYDHLDLRTVRALAKSQPHVLFAVPSGMKAWFATHCSSAVVVEFDSGDELNISDDSRAPLKICCVPCQHWCKRTLHDTNRCLWATSGHPAWWARLGSFSTFGGDTGYCGERTSARLARSILPISPPSP